MSATQQGADKGMTARVHNAIDEMFADTSVTQTDTHNRLSEVIEYCRELQDALDEAEQHDNADARGFSR